MNRTEFVTNLAQTRPSTMFISVLNYTNAYSEVADYSLLFHASYKTALEKSIHILQSYSPSSVLEEEAKLDLLQKYNSALWKFSSSSEEELEPHYSWLKDADNNYIKGIKMHNKTGALYLYGYVMHKRITIPGIYPDSSEEKEITKVKKKLARMCPASKYRLFKIDVSNFDCLTIDNKSLTLPEIN